MHDAGVRFTEPSAEPTRHRSSASDGGAAAPGAHSLQSRKPPAGAHAPALPPGAAVCDLDERLLDVARRLVDEERGCLVVLERRDPPRVAGLLTDRDVCRAFVRGHAEPAALRVRDAVSPMAGGLELPAVRSVGEARAPDGSVETWALVDRRQDVLAFLTLLRLGGAGGAGWQRQA